MSENPYRLAEEVDKRIISDLKKLGYDMTSSDTTDIERVCALPLLNYLRSIGTTIDLITHDIKQRIKS